VRRLPEGTYVEHEIGGARGIVTHDGRVFVHGTYFSLTVNWQSDNLLVRRDNPSDRLWSAYVAWRLSQ